MEQTINQGQPLNQSPVSNPPPVSRPNKSSFPLILVVLLIILVGFGSFLLGKSLSSPKIAQPPVVSEISPTPTVSTTISPATEITPEISLSATVTPGTLQVKGANLTEIRYTLPQGWTAKLNNDNLFISPDNGGGFLTIRVYDYLGNTGRREYYCQITKFCTEQSYFTEMNIGNISGYKANALDNSGGGPEYFGAKGDKFYVISTYTPPSPNEFEKNFQNVLNSLIF